MSIVLVTQDKFFYVQTFKQQIHSKRQTFQNTTHLSSHHTLKEKSQTLYKNVQTS